MMRWISLATLLGLLAGPAAADTAERILNGTGAGINVTRAMMQRSFAGWLHKRSIPDAAALADLPAGYDPASDTRMTAGTAYFVLAEANRRLRRDADTNGEILARILEYRTRWLAGDLDQAHDQATDLVTQMAAIGLDDRAMVSVLADAAVLSLRRGDIDAANAYLVRARACGVPDCPHDIVNDWAGQRRKTDYDFSLEQAADTLWDTARTDAQVLLPDADAVLARIDRERAFAKGEMGPDLRRLLTLAWDTEDSAALGQTDRRAMREMAERLVGWSGLLDYEMTGKSTAAAWRDLDPAIPEMHELFPNEVSYLDAAAFTTLRRHSAGLIVLLRHSDRPEDAIVGEALRLRRLMIEADYDRAATGLERLIETARADGHTDGDLHGVWADLWAMGLMLDDAGMRDRALSATARCRSGGCGPDLITRFFDRAGELPRWNRGAEAEQAHLDISDRLLRRTWPGDALKLADLYQYGASSQSRPMDAAREAILSLGFAESVADIPMDDLVRRAASAMDQQVYAGHYRVALDIADRIEARVIKQGPVKALDNRRFWQTRARAAFRIGDDRARDHYRVAIENGVTKSLAMDILDTPYAELFPSAFYNRPLAARAAYRMGDPARAAAFIEAERRTAIERGKGAFNADEFMMLLLDDVTSRADLHLKLGQLDRYAALIRRHAALKAREDVPVNHHVFYARSDYLIGMAIQEAFYRDAAGETARAGALRALGGHGPDAFRWIPPSDTADPAALIRFAAADERSYDLIRTIIDMRDEGNHEGAAHLLQRYGWVAQGAIENGAYIDAQALWQMAFTFVKVGKTAIAFDLMDRAARIAATLSFKDAGGADGGTLQLLERDRWRYLLYVDIAWAAATGTPPEDMLVVSRY